MSGEGSSTEDRFKGFSDAEKAMIKEEVNQQLGRLTKLFGVVNALVVLGGVTYLFTVVPGMIKHQVSDNVTATAKARIDESETANRKRIDEALENNQSKMNSSLAQYDRMITKSLDEKSKAIDSLSQVAFTSISKKNDELNEKALKLQFDVLNFQNEFNLMQANAKSFQSELDGLKNQYQKSKVELDAFAGITEKAVKSDVFVKFDKFSKILDQNNTAANLLKSINDMQLEIKSARERAVSDGVKIAKIRYSFSFGNYKFSDDYGEYGEFIRHSEPNSSFDIKSRRQYGYTIDAVWAIPLVNQNGDLIQEVVCGSAANTEISVKGRLPSNSSWTYIEVYVAYRGFSIDPAPPPPQAPPVRFN